MRNLKIFHLELLNRHYNRVADSQREWMTGAKRKRESVRSAQSKFVDPNWGGRYAHAQGRLYIVIHDIGADSLSSPSCQECLSLLAACASVSIIATVEHLNTPSLWNPSQLSRFNWMYEHIPTYVNFPLTKKSAFVSDRNKTIEQFDSSAVDHVLASVTHKHKEIFAVLCGIALQEVKSASEVPASKEKTARNKQPSFTVLIGDLLSKCKQKMLCRTMNDLVTILNEFVDHRLVVVNSKDNNVTLNISIEQIERYGELQK